MTVIADITAILRPRIVVVENVQAFFVRQIRHPQTSTPLVAANTLLKGCIANMRFFQFS